MAAEHAAETAAEHGQTAGQYILHHLTFWQNHPPRNVVDFTVFNFDSIFFGVLLGALVCYFLWKAAHKATSGVPGRFQAAVEILVEFVDTQTKGIIHQAESRKAVAPLGLIVFLWIVAMNTMDLLPVDLLPSIWEGVQGNPEAKLRVVPTADLSMTLGLSVSILLISLYYNVKIKGAGGWIHELFTAPFGNHWALYPFNVAMQIIEFVAKTVSHGMRLFGNMYAGELIFMLIALMGAAFFTSVGIPLAIGHIIAGSVWAIFHILIITLQAFVFMMLTLVYIGQAHDAH